MDSLTTQGMIFLGITLIAWAVITYGTEGMALFKTWFGSTAESRLDSLYLFVDGNRIFIYFVVGLLLFPLLAVSYTHLTLPTIYSV